MKILITGAQGMLGSVLTKHFSKNSNFQIYGCSRLDLDITNHDNVSSKLNEIKPDIIIHTAALTNVELCETEKDLAKDINLEGTRNLLENSNGAKFIFISSTGIYGTTKNNIPYSEEDIPQPTTFYHKTKYESEKLIQENANKYLIIRTGWIFSKDYHQKKNFVARRLDEFRSKETVHSNSQQCGSPTSAHDLATQIEILISKDISGVFNCVNNGEPASRYHYVKEILKNSNSTCDLKEITAEHFNRVAPVSDNESAINKNLKKINLDLMPDWKDSIKKCINEMDKEISP